MMSSTFGRLVSAIGFIAGGFSTSERVSAEEEGFVSLFNGKDLSGWVNVNCSPATWTVRDGMVISTGKPTGVLRSEKQYENFIVELEWRHMVKGGNAGFFVWSDAITSKGVPFTRSIECQVLDGSESKNHTSHGDVFSIHGAVLTPDRPHPAGTMRCLPSEMRSKPSPEWNHYRITCKDGTLKLAVNGKEVSGGYDINPRKGYVCLESEGSETHFRNIRLKELPPSKTPLDPKQIAAVDEGFQSLYSGADLAGWKVAAGDEDHWKAKNWTLESDGKGHTLWSDRELGDFVLIVDHRLMEAPKGNDPGTTVYLAVFLRGSTDCGVQIPSAENDAWSRAVITVKGEVVKIELDGKIATESARCPATRGRIGLDIQGARLQLANIYVKDL